MRALFFRWLLGLLERHTPGIVRRIEIQVLLNATARAFGRRGIRVWTQPADRALSSYAAFTKACIEEGGADPADIFAEAFRTGALLRALTGFRKTEDLSRLVFWLYRNIGITMGGHIPGTIAVEECFFSRFYTPEQCALMSHMDSGVISGLCGGGQLHFSQRITEGMPRCIARFQEGA